MEFKEKIAHIRSNVIYGKRVDLYPYGMEFLDEIVRLRNQPAVKYFVSQNFDVTHEMQTNWIKGYEQRQEEFGFMVKNKRGEVVGICFCYNYDGHSMEIGRTTFDTTRVMGMPYTLETYMICADLVFDYLHLPIMRVMMKSDNLALMKFCKRLNWTTTGTKVIRDDVYVTMELKASESNHKSFKYLLEKHQRVAAQASLRVPA